MLPQILQVYFFEQLYKGVIIATVLLLHRTTTFTSDLYFMT